MIRFLLLVLLATSTTIASAAEVPDSARTLAYIHRAWGTLTRSATDCASYRGPYQRGEQVLYVPKDLPMPRGLQNFRGGGSSREEPATESWRYHMHDMPHITLYFTRVLAA